MLCSVIPYTRSIDDRLITYHLPDEFIWFVQIGSSVKIPWWKEVIIGIVADIDHEIPYEWTLKSVENPHCSIPLLSQSEITCIVMLARRLFLRIHVVAQMFLPITLFSALEKNNFLDLVPPQEISPSQKHDEYIVASNIEQIISYLQKALHDSSWAVILPDGLSVEWWARECQIRSAILDTHSRSITKQKNVYQDMLCWRYRHVFGTRKTLLKRLWHFRDIYIIHENLSPYVMFWLRKIPLFLLCEELSKHGYIIHYITTTPSIRTITHFLHNKKSVQYL